MPDGQTGSTQVPACNGWFDTQHVDGTDDNQLLYCRDAVRDHQRRDQQNFEEVDRCSSRLRDTQHRDEITTALKAPPVSRPKSRTAEHEAPPAPKPSLPTHSAEGPCSG
eukprot:9445887-Pyramimonas_sp.AAC.1